MQFYKNIAQYIQHKHQSEITKKEVYLKIVYLLLDLAWFLFFSFFIAIPFWVCIHIAQSHKYPILFIFGAAAYGLLSVFGTKKIVQVLSATERWTFLRKKIDTIIKNSLHGNAAQFVKKWEYIALLVMSIGGFAQTALIISENSKSLLPHAEKCIYFGVFLSAFVGYFFFQGGSIVVNFLISLF